MSDVGSQARTVIRQMAPNLPDERVAELAAIWDEVVNQVIRNMLALESLEERTLHINMRSEMAFEIAKMSLFLTKKVVEMRVAHRPLQSIEPEAERSACFGPAGLQIIETTARNLHGGHWKKLMEDRWLPKSQKALEKEASPPKKRDLSPKPVRDKHFISRWFIRDHWADGPNTTRWRKSGETWSKDRILFGSWGHRQGLWSDRLEAYFGLLEGDAKRPLQMLLAVEPLNQPQQLAFVGHLVVHLLRNPKFVEGLRISMREMMESAAAERGVSFEELARAAYETLYNNNEIYDAYARPLLWSRWAIVSSREPVFVLPDTFCATGVVDNQIRIIAPLTPYKCFVTLRELEKEKSIVPIQHLAQPELAREISNLLIAASATEFLSHPELIFELNGGGPQFSDVLANLEVILADR